MLNFIKKRLAERSTWLGIITIITAAGVKLSPDQIDVIVTAGVAIAGAIAVFTADTPSAP